MIAPRAEEMSIAPPFWTVSWDLFAWMGHRRLGRHWSVPQIRAELADTFSIHVSADLIEDYTTKYEVMVAAREGDTDLLVAQYEQEEDLVLSIDGLQPEKGHECLYVVRELNQRRVWFAEPLLSSSADEVRRLFERAKEIAERLGKPVRCWISDKQQAFVSGVAITFPDVPHRYCANHFLRDVAKPVLEADSHAKVKMRRKVRGLRDIERRMLSIAQAQETTQTSDSTSATMKPACETFGLETRPATSSDARSEPTSPARDQSQPVSTPPTQHESSTASYPDSRVPDAGAERDDTGNAIFESSDARCAPKEGGVGAPLRKTCIGNSDAPTPQQSPSNRVVGAGGAGVMASATEEVVLDYCAAVRGIVNDNHGGPLRPPGLRMAEALKEVHASLGRATAEKKKGPVSVPSTTLPAA
jgi:hypothetical protein